MFVLFSGLVVVVCYVLFVVIDVAIDVCTKVGDGLRNNRQ